MDGVQPHVATVRVLRIVSGILAGALLLAPRPTSACDVCAIYVATEVAQSRTGFRLGVWEQWSHNTTERLNGRTIPSFGERLDSSTTQFLLGYQLTERVGLQLSLPLIARTWRRLENGRFEDGSTVGPGDLSLLGTLQAYAHHTEHSVFLLNLVGGLKLPSGNPDFLAEELEPVGAPAGPGVPLRGVPLHSTSGGDDDHHDEPGRRLFGGIHGHDLALGSGSVDGILGASTYWSYDRFFVSGIVQYAVRREGAFGYRYANDLTWFGGPGWYPLLNHLYTLGLQMVLSGETKGKDTQMGERLDDTALTALYFGPGVRFTWGTQLSAELYADLPVLQNNTALQTLPTFRLRGGLVWRF
jgi:hypothetical protein